MCEIKKKMFELVSRGRRMPQRSLFHAVELYTGRRSLLHARPDSV